MTRPGHIRVGPIRVRIISDRRTDPILDDLDRRGDSDLARATIRIASYLSDDVWLETLAHEVMHFCWGLAGLDEVKEPSEEQTVAMLTPWLRTLGFLDWAVE
jgi:hypothetical protein